MGDNLSGGEDNSTSQEDVKQAVALGSFSWGDPLTLSRADSLAAACARELIGFDLLSLGKALPGVRGRLWNMSICLCRFGF